MAVWVEKGDVMSTENDHALARCHLLAQFGYDAFRSVTEQSEGESTVQRQDPASPTLSVTMDDLDEVVEKVKVALARYPTVVAFAKRNPREFERALDLLLRTL